MTQLIEKQGNLTLTQDGDHYIMEGGQYGSHSIYAPEWDENSDTRIQAHWMGYCENNGQDYDAIDDSIPAIATEEPELLNSGDHFPLYVNQGQREAFIIGTLGDLALAEYEMPAGTTGLQIIPRDGSRNWGKNIGYRTCPKKWIQAIREGEGGWEGNSQTRGYIDFPEEK